MSIDTAYMALMRSQKIDRLKRIGKEGGWIIAGQISTLFGSLVLVRVLTDNLHPALYGELALGLTIAALVNNTMMGGVINGATRYYSIAVEQNDLAGYLSATLKLFTYAALGVGVISILLIQWLFWTSKLQWITLLLATLLFAVLTGANATLSAMQNAARQRSIVAMHSAIDAWMKILLVICVMKWLGPSSVGVVISYALSAMIVMVSQIYFLNKRQIASQQTNDTNAGRTNWVKQIWAYSWPFVAWGIFTWAQSVSDRWALELFTSKNELGGYVVLYQLGFVPISTASSFIVNLIGPIMYQRAGAANDSSRVIDVYRVTKNIAFIVLLLSIVIALFTLLFHNEIFNILTNERYHIFSHLMPWLVIAGGFQAAHHVLGIRVTSMLKTKLMLLPQIFSSFIFVGLNVLGAYLGGMPGLVYAFALSSIIYFLWMLVLSKYMVER